MSKKHHLQMQKGENGDRPKQSNVPCPTCGKPMMQITHWGVGIFSDVATVSYYCKKHGTPKTTQGM